MARWEWHTCGMAWVPVQAELAALMLAIGEPVRLAEGMPPDDAERALAHLLRALNAVDVESALATIRKHVPQQHLCRPERPYERTCRLLNAYLRELPGVRVKGAVREIEHHWKSDAQAVERLTELLRKGAVPGVDATLDAGVMRLYPAGLMPEGAASVAWAGKALDEAGMHVTNQFGSG